jgi:hypothetical protein
MTAAQPTKIRRVVAAVRAQAELLLRARHPERAVTTPWIREPDADGLQDVPDHREP